MHPHLTLPIARTLNDFCVWLDGTALSQVIQSQAWIVPTVQSIHILAFALVVASALMINLRLTGIFARDQSLDRISARFLPFIWWPISMALWVSIIFAGRWIAYA